jgi:NAD-dependent dihydropyrimidine dehydrogenase PreA subunit
MEWPEHSAWRHNRGYFVCTWLPLPLPYPEAYLQQLRSNDTGSKKFGREPFGCASLCHKPDFLLEWPSLDRLIDRRGSKIKANFQEIETLMAYVIAEPCIGTKDTACVDACPVDCIHPKKDEPAYETAELLYIDPVECIDCGACVPVCPVSAIFALDDLPEKWKDFTEKNAQYYGR